MVQKRSIGNSRERNAEGEDAKYIFGIMNAEAALQLQVDFFLWAPTDLHVFKSRL